LKPILSSKPMNLEGSFRGMKEVRSWMWRLRSI
jgi:hypothetical protein